MYYINEHLKGKTSANYPEDFPLLSNGLKFYAHREPDGWHIQTILSGKELKAELQALKK